MNRRSSQASAQVVKRALRRFGLALPLLAYLCVAAPSGHATTGGAKDSGTGVGYFGTASSLPKQVPGRSSILVKIRPRQASAGTPAGDGSAIISLLDGAGNVIVSFDGSVVLFNGRAVGVRGPRRDIRKGDTPFGVYIFTTTDGGTAASRLGTGYGTGKVYVNDRNVFGEVADFGRSEIRLHGGGSGLPNPYALNQTLRPTLGCVRMRNGDVNDLIRIIRRLPADRSLRFIFMGSEEYLRRQANDSTLSGRSWWPILRIILGLPAPAPEPERIAPDSSASEQEEEDSQRLRGSDAEIAELVRQFSADEGEVGQSALRSLQPQADALQRLQRDLPQTDSLQPQLAFTRCYLGSDCETNRRVVEAALSNTSPYRNLPAEKAAQMLSRLIDKSDDEGQEAEATEMLEKLFEAAPTSDGALPEALGVTFSDKLRTRTRIFFSAFGPLFSSERAEPSPDRSSLKIRAEVYELMRTIGKVTEADLRRARQQARNLRESAPELNETLNRFSQEYLQHLRQTRQRRRERRHQ